jgi:hypothetical protein
MRTFGSRLLVIGLAMSLAGCFTPGTIPPKVNDQPEAKSAPAHLNQYKRLGLIAISEPKLYDIRTINYNIPTPGVTLPGRLVGGGLVALLKGTDATSKNYRLTETLHDAGFNFSSELQRDLIQALQQKGFQVTVIPEENRPGRHFMRSYPDQGNVDAYVDTYIDFAGYTTINPSQPYVPTVEIPVQVVDANTKQVVYSSTFRYGGPIPTEGVASVKADDRYNVRDFEKLESSSRQAIEGLRAGAQSLSELIAQNFK